MTLSQIHGKIIIVIKLMLHPKLLVLVQLNLKLSYQCTCTYSIVQLVSRFRGMNQQKLHWGSEMIINFSLLFYSPKPHSHARILIYQNWFIHVLSIFCMVLTGRICFKIRAFNLWWSFPYSHFILTCVFIEVYSVIVSRKKILVVLRGLILKELLKLTRPIK